MAPLVTKNFVMIDVILSYNKANNTFFNSLRKNDVDAQVKITVKLMERGRGHLLLLDSLLVYVPKFLGILAGRCGRVVVRERD